MTTSNIIANAVDWERIARRMVDEMRKMIHEENFYGTDEVRYAEALRRALGYEDPAEGRYERLKFGYGLITQAEMKDLVDGHTIVDRLGRERAEEQIKEMRAEVARVYREARKDVADYLRERCNERTVPSRYRREGVTWAADMIDPAVPKDPYGNLLPGGGE